MKELPRKRR